MAQPPAYNRQVDFTDRDSDQTDHPALNAELDDAAQAINRLRDSLAAIQRDDQSLRLPAAALRPEELNALAGQALAAAGRAESAQTAATADRARALQAFTGGQDRGDWTAATAYQAGQIVWVGNVGYQAKQDHTSGATFAADLAAGKWVAVQGVTRADLAEAEGAALVGFQQLGVGAVPRAMLDKARESVSLADFGVAGGTGLDVGPQIQAAIIAAAAIGRDIKFAPEAYVCSAIILASVQNVRILGNGASIVKPAGSGTNSMLFNIRGGCKNIEISGFAALDGGYPSSSPSTGSNPVILIGDQTGGGDGGLENTGIVIRGNHIMRANWGGVVVYGRSNSGVTLTPKNTDILVAENTISDCGGNGVFAYKNARNIRVVGNTITGIATDGIVVDTMAASDTVTSEPITDVHISGNTIKGFGKVGQGIGILVKGAVTDFRISGNNVSDGLVQPSGSFVNYGILVNRDAAGSGAGRGIVTGNTVSNIASTLSSVGIVAGAGCHAIAILANSVFNCIGAGVNVLAGASECVVSGNIVDSCGNSTYGYRIEGTSSEFIKSIVCVGNVFRKGSSAAVGGFRFDYVDGSEIAANCAFDFTTSAVNITNSTRYKSEREFSGTAAPTSGAWAQGDIVVNTSTTTLSPVDRWRCLVSGSPGVWRPASWVTGRAPTASRPPLTSSDIGVQFLDTSLAPLGKLITWGGTAWVDADGVQV